MLCELHATRDNSTGKDTVPVPISKREQTDLPPAPPSALYNGSARNKSEHATRSPDWLWSTRVSTTPGRTASAHPASAVSASCDRTLAGQALRRVGPGGLSPLGNGDAQVTASVDVDPAW